MKLRLLRVINRWDKSQIKVTILTFTVALNIFYFVRANFTLMCAC